ncbi:ketopantoate reductase family protein [Agrococcus sp. HG114]|uniref:ketopantoate reductase family protein n=1 Tax=Agrococcus sp. HG114 TaxID=2969757 RepID=UPI00215A69E1|nr:2-dehydropantoate 2-reductase [Agrococcus sp. HG114]MCR8671171.1 2-dehydropantoate 2-reductase [Agrococcus sp. HG114]
MAIGEDPARPERQRVAVIGAGAIGGTMAALLHAAGHDVTVTARGEHLAAIRAHGLRLRGGFGALTAPVVALERLEEAPDVAILAVKATGAAAAIEQNRAALDAVPLLVAQNGLYGEREAARLLGHDRVAGALSLIAANSLEPGVVTVTAPSATVVGGAEAERFAALLGEVMPVERTPDLEGAQWTKLLINMVNAIPAIVGHSVQDVIRDPGLRRVMVASMRECARTGLASGVRWQPMQGLTPALVRLVAWAPSRIAQQVPLRIRGRLGDVPNLGSTQQSIRRGQPTEVDRINGAVVEAAARVGREAPVNAALVELVHEVERTGRFAAPSVVRRLA